MKLIAALLALAGTSTLLHATPIAGGPCVPSGSNIDYGTLAEYVALGGDGCSLSQLGQTVTIYDIGVELPPLASPDLSVYRAAAYNGETSSAGPIQWPGFTVWGAPFTALPAGTVFSLSWSASVPTRARGGEFSLHVGLPVSSPDSTTGIITATMTQDLPVLVLIELTGEGAPGPSAPLTNAPVPLTNAPEPSAFLPLLGIGLLLAAKKNPLTAS